MLKNDYLLVKIGVDRAENEPFKSGEGIREGILRSSEASAPVCRHLGADEALAKDAALADAAAKGALAEEAKRALSEKCEELQDSHELANHLVMSENKKMTEIDESRKKIQALEDENRRLRELAAAAAPQPPPTRPPISPGFDFGASGL